ncbi:MAG: DegT/DnrJ/EryC1/StrS family aminotransferase, partial [Nanoarchaeota archaeon]|nr:DegT/DnrJ/EryC1/StrS family aminotransferase [Nanoarchaeota archaeon]
MVIELLKKYTGHRYIRLTSRGNTAIFAALYCVRGVKGIRKVLIPDQGGWLTYLKYPKMLGMPVEVLKTDNALIDLKELEEQSKGCCAFLYAQPGGYFVNQDIKKIYEICKKNKCLVIMDVTGSIGTTQCSGKYCDFMVCSFGSYKPVNLGYGGFVSTNNKSYFDKPKEIFNTDKFDIGKLSLLSLKLESLKKRYQLFEENNKKVKQDLNDFD